MKKILALTIGLFLILNCSGKNSSQDRSSDPSGSGKLTPEFRAAKSLINQATDLIDKRKYNLAESKLEKAIQILPYSGEAYYWLAYNAYYQENFDYALQLLDKAEVHSDLYFKEWAQKIGELRDLIRQEISSKPY